MRIALRCVLLALLYAALSAGVAEAHVVSSPGYSEITRDGREVSYRLSLEYDVLTKAVDLGAPATDDTARAAALEEHADGVEAYLVERVMVYLDGAACESELGGTGTSSRNSKAYADLDLHFTCPGDDGSYRLVYKVFAAEEAVADNHTNLADHRFGDRSGRTVFDRGTDSVTVGDQSMAGAGLRFGRMGVEHILSGLDHVLFVVVLMLGASSVQSLFKVVSAFTVAHSVTLVSTLLAGVTAPPEVVEPLIALSIAFVAAENLIGAATHRLWVVFGFGLLHGLGFAGSLRITEDVDWGLAVSLLSFNAGIEGGQVILLTAVFPLIVLVRRSRLSVPVVRAATVAIAGIALFWFVERFLGA